MIENKGDLISREALKKAYFNAINETSIGEVSIIALIDNAPTVEPFEPDYVGAERLKARQRGYEEGYHNGMAIGKTLNPKIKQGEWVESHIFSCGKILRMQLDVIEHKCKNCGRWSIKWVETIPDNFCSYCGANIGYNEEAKNEIMRKLSL